MNQDQKELTLEESIKQVMQTLPLLIRNYLAQGKYSEIANRLMAKYSLHVDQGGILEREIMLLLMGIENPDEFTKSLTEEANLDQQIINGIVQDVNDQIFVPLREEERKTGQPAKPAVPRPLNVPPASPASGLPTGSGMPQGSVPNYTPRPPVASQPVGVVGPPPQSPTYFHREGNVSQFIRRAQPPAPVNPQQPPRPVVAPSGVGPAVAKPAVPIPPPPLRQGSQTPIKPVADEKLLEDHEEPHIEFNKNSPPPNLPGAAIAPKINLPTIPIPPKPTVPPAPSKPYSSDPYREPIEEK